MNRPVLQTKMTTSVLLTIVGILAAGATVASDLNVNFAQFLHENRICATSTGWVRGPYSCLCLNGTLAGCLNNNECSFTSSCLPLQRCAVEDFVKCESTLLNLQGLDCSTNRQCQVVRRCRPVLVKRTVCINGAQDSGQHQFQPLGFKTVQFSPLQVDQNVSNATELVGNDTSASDGETVSTNATDVTPISTVAPPTVNNNTNLAQAGNTSIPDNNATDIMSPDNDNANATNTSVPDESATETSTPEDNGNNATNISMNETVAPESQNRSTTAAPICWLESAVALRCQNITSCYPKSQCTFQPVYTNLTICKQNGACQDPATCRPVWMCNQDITPV